MNPFHHFFSLKGFHTNPFIIMFALFFIGISGCQPLPHVSVEKHENVSKPSSWNIQDVQQWFQVKGRGLQQISAMAKVSAGNGENEETFDAFLLLSNEGKGRIEVYGPLKVLVSYLIFDPNSVFLYISGESRLYIGENNPYYIKKLIGLPLDLFILFDLVASNLPPSLSPCVYPLLEQSTFPRFCLTGVDRGVNLQAFITVKDFPSIDEIIFTGDEQQKNFKVRYSDSITAEGYNFPKTMSLFWPEGTAWNIRFKSIKVNQEVPLTYFTPNESWFAGEVIDMQRIFSGEAERERNE